MLVCQQPLLGAEISTSCNSAAVCTDTTIKQYKAMSKTFEVVFVLSRELAERPPKVPSNLKLFFDTRLSTTKERKLQESWSNALAFFPVKK